MLHEAGLSFFAGVVFLGMDGNTIPSNYITSIRFDSFFPEAAVIGSERFKDVLRAKIPDHFEVALATTGTMVAILAIGTALLRRDTGPNLTFVVWFLGMILWAVRRHIRVGREDLVRKLRVMLQDRVNNQLTILVGLTDIHTHAAPTDVAGDDVELALAAARAVSREIETLSIESLRSWEGRYAEHLPSYLR